MLRSSFCLGYLMGCLPLVRLPCECLPDLGSAHMSLRGRCMRAVPPVAAEAFFLDCFPLAGLWCNLHIDKPVT